MGTLPHDILDLRIPPNMDRRGTSSSLRTTFDDADDVRKIEREVSRDQQRDDYNISTMSAEMRESTGRIGTGASAHADRTFLGRKEKQRKETSTDLQLQLAAMQLQTFESGLIDQYGENFDLDLLGELTQDGHFSEDEYAAFASIEDPEMRRRAIAQAIQDKIDAGEIDPADLADHPWALDWLDKHEAARVERDMNAQSVREDRLGVSDASIDVQDEVSRDGLDLSHFETDAEKASKEANQSVVTDGASIGPLKFV